MIIPSNQPGRITIGEGTFAPSKTLCYCFGYTEEDVTRDLAVNRESTILPTITAEIRARNCDCETKNPSGKCCLKDVRLAIQSYEQQSEKST